MCEFCHQHGEGKKWYLKAQNYSEDLLSDIKRRRIIKKFALGTSMLKKKVLVLDVLSKIPGLIKYVLAHGITGRMKKVHFGQVVPIEDVERILDIVNSIVRIECLCRHVTLGAEKRYCYGLSLGPNGGRLFELLDDIDCSYIKGPDNSGLEVLEKSEVLEQFRDYERQGLCHTVWTFKSPFICGICNCDRTDCIAMKTSITRNIPVMFRAEYAAEIDPDRCTGCRRCMDVCQFSAIRYSAADKKVVIDYDKCYGCGICRSVCPADAITLRDRVSIAPASQLWQ